MPLTPPNLDDRTQRQVFEDARRLIPRYAPEWTDHNASDPGITLLQLFAWMTEMTLYHLNQVPQRNYVKFLQLLGIELEPARPARADLTFELDENADVVVMVPKGTRTAAEAADGDPLLFETRETLVALSASLTEVWSYDGSAFSSQVTRNDSVDQYFYPFARHAREGSALVLGFDSNQPFTDETFSLSFYPRTEDLAPEGRHCDLDLAGVPAPAILVWESWTGDRWWSRRTRRAGSPDRAVCISAGRVVTFRRGR